MTERDKNPYDTTASLSRIVYSELKTIKLLTILMSVMMLTTLFLAGIIMNMRVPEESEPQKIETTKISIIVIQPEEPIQIEEDIFEEEETEVEIVEETPESEITETQQKTYTSKEKIDIFITEVAQRYDLDPNLIRAIVEHESKYNPNAENGQYKGLMQVGYKWHSKRMAKLGVTDILDPYGNLLVGCDYLSDLLDRYDDPSLALMAYAAGDKAAQEEYNTTGPSNYAKQILQRAQELGGIYGTS